MRCVLTDVRNGYAQLGRTGLRDIATVLAISCLASGWPAAPRLHVSGGDTETSRPGPEVDASAQSAIGQMRDVSDACRIASDGGSKVDISDAMEVFLETRFAAPGQEWPFHELAMPRRGRDESLAIVNHPASVPVWRILNLRA